MSMLSVKQFGIILNQHIKKAIFWCFVQKGVALLLRESISNYSTLNRV